MIRVYNKETGALLFDGADDQVPVGLRAGDPISFVEDTYVVEDVQENGADRTVFVRHQKMC